MQVSHFNIQVLLKNCALATLFLKIKIRRKTQVLYTKYLKNTCTTKLIKFRIEKKPKSSIIAFRLANKGASGTGKSERKFKN